MIFHMLANLFLWDPLGSFWCWKHCVRHVGCTIHAWWCHLPVPNSVCLARVHGGDRGNLPWQKELWWTVCIASWWSYVPLKWATWQESNGGLWPQKMLGMVCATSFFRRSAARFMHGNAIYGFRPFLILECPWFFCIHVLNVFKIKDHSCCTHAAFMSHACCIHVTCMHHEGLLPSIFHACETGSRFADMAHFEQAALLATAWANDDKIQAMALRHAIVEVSKNKRLKRSRILSEILASKANVLKIMHVSDAIPSQVMWRRTPRS